MHIPCRNTLPKVQNVEDLEITTLRDAMYIGVKNDVSFLFNQEMCLYEHQSTVSKNMPLRGLGYFADLYQIHIGGSKELHNRLYSSTKLSIPTPKYYVFYNGGEDYPDRRDLYLSDLYSGDGDLEVVAHVINVNIGHNEELLKSCKALSDMAVLLYKVRAYSREMTKEDAVERAIDECIEEHILEDILRKERARVANSLITGITEEERERIHAWELEQIRKQGIDSIIRMNEYLISAGRIDDLKRATSDPEYRRQILEELGMQ